MELSRIIQTIVMLRKYLFLVFYLQNIVFVVALEEVECEAISNYETKPLPSGFTFKCSIRFTYSKHNVSNRFESNCNNFEFDKSSLVVTAIAPIHNVSFICNSNYPISTKVDFANGTVLKPYLNMKWSRTLEDFTNVSTYSYVLRTFPSEVPVNWETGDVIKYTFFSADYPNEIIQVLWFSLRSFTTRSNSKRMRNLVYWMSDGDNDNRELVTSDEEIFVPCVSPFRMQLHQYKNSKWNHMKNAVYTVGGFLMNTNDNDTYDGHYCCVLDSSRLPPQIEPRNFNFTLNFTIVEYPNFTASIDVYHNTKRNNSKTEKSFVPFGYNSKSLTEKNTTFYDFYGLQLKLKCRSSSFNVTWILFSNNKRMDLNVTYASRRFPTNRQFYSAECVAPEGEINRDIQYKCVKVDNDTKSLQKWNIVRIPEKKSLNASAHKPEFPITGKLQCTFGYGNIQQESCNNPVICSILSKQITQKDSTVNYNYCHNKNKKELCPELRPLQKGILLCSTKGGLNGNLHQYQNIYYNGFNQKRYLGMNYEPPIEAIFKIQNFGEKNQFLTNGNMVNFTFRCEAHSFYFDEGLQWLFEYKNGSQVLIPSENILPLDIFNDDSEFSNPTSFIKIIVGDTNIKRIVCAAPRSLSFKKENWESYRELWEFVSEDIVITQAFIIADIIWTMALPTILILISVLILLTIMFYCLLNMHKRKYKRKYIIKRIQIHEEQMMNKRQSGEYPHLRYLQQYCNFDDTLELKEHSFCVDENTILGDAPFTYVLKGKMAKLKSDVAFKTVKSRGNITEIKNLLSELEIMNHIGKHKNVVELLGGHTQHIGKGIIYIAMEFCELGNLVSYLRTNKCLFINRPISTGSDQEVPNSQLAEKESPESFPHTIKSVLKWCLEICNGMNFIQSKNVIHGDLAARNVLLTADGVAKLTDFGLSRKTDDGKYEHDGQIPLPWRWLAIETIQKLTFSVKYEIMLACWNYDPKKRPSFSTLSLIFQNILNNENFHLSEQDLKILLAEEKAEYLIITQGSTIKT